VAGRRALFLDRDGTIIRDAGFPRDPAAVEPLPGAAAALARLRAIGWALVIVSNQSGVARGLIRPEEALAVQERVAELFAREGVVFDGAYFCFHGPDDGCACRKPRPGMVERAARELDLDLRRSILIGDRASDVAAGRAAGTEAIALAEAPVAGASAVLATWDEALAYLLRFGERQEPC
jgi:histidinol-phosphate phosphatase family protein